MLIEDCLPVLLVVCTRQPPRRDKLGSDLTCVESSRVLWLLSLVACGIARIAVLHVVVTMCAKDCRLG